VDAISCALMEDTLEYVYVGFFRKFELLGSLKIPCGIPTPKVGGCRKSTILPSQTLIPTVVFKRVDFCYLCTLCSMD